MDFLQTHHLMCKLELSETASDTLPNATRLLVQLWYLRSIARIL